MASDYGMLSFGHNSFMRKMLGGGTTKITFKTLKRLRNTEVL